MRTHAFLAVTLVALLAGSCSRSTERRPRASADLDPRSASTVTGHADFTEVSQGVTITITVAGAMPGPHGVHLHQVGDCTADDAKSAGDHWNPEASAHGAPTSHVHHAGDLGNITIGADGRGELTLLAPDLTVRAGSHSVVGHAVVIHGAADDLATQPAGNSGPRIACGVIAIRLK